MQASIGANTWVVSGTPQTKSMFSPLICHGVVLLWFSAPFKKNCGSLFEFDNVVCVTISTCSYSVWSAHLLGISFSVQVCVIVFLTYLFYIWTELQDLLPSIINQLGTSLFTMFVNTDPVESL